MNAFRNHIHNHIHNRIHNQNHIHFGVLPVLSKDGWHSFWLPALHHLIPMLRCERIFATALWPEKARLVERPSLKVNTSHLGMQNGGVFFYFIYSSVTGNIGIMDIEKARIRGLFVFTGRNNGIRTHDPFHPKEVRYHAALCPDTPWKEAYQL